MEKQQFLQFKLASTEAISSRQVTPSLVRRCYKLTDADFKKAKKLGLLEENAVWVSGTNLTGIVQYGKFAKMDKPTWSNYVTEESRKQNEINKAVEAKKQKLAQLDILLKDKFISQEEYNKMRLDILTA